MCIRDRTSILMSGLISGDMMSLMTGTGGKNKLITSYNLWYKDLFFRSFFNGFEKRSVKNRNRSIIESMVRG